MKTEELIATSEATINAPLARVWDALVNPDMIKKYMFGTTVTSDWREGSKITWKGEWNGKAYEDKGVIKQLIPNSRLQYTHFSPMTGLPDKPENYHTVTIELADNTPNTVVRLTQDNNATEEEKTHSEKNWGMMLDGLKELLEL